jgi:hypothetical protein
LTSATRRTTIASRRKRPAHKAGSLPSKDARGGALSDLQILGRASRAP